MPFRSRRRRPTQIDETGQKFEPNVHPAFQGTLQQFGLNYQKGMEAIFSSLEVQKDTGIPQGFWTKSVPVKGIFPVLKGYVKNGNAIHVSLNGEPFLSLKIVKVLPNVQNIQIHFTVNDKAYYHEIPYINAKMRDFFLGNWTSFGIVEARCNPNEMLPKFQYFEETQSVLLSWVDGPEARVKNLHWSLFLFNKFLISRIKVKSLEVQENSGTFDARGLGGYLLPMLVWV